MNKNRTPQESDFADLVKEWRRANDLTQEEAAASLEVNVRTLQNWECSRNVPIGYVRAMIEKIISY